MGTRWSERDALCVAQKAITLISGAAETGIPIERGPGVSRRPLTVPSSEEILSVPIALVFVRNLFVGFFLRFAHPLGLVFVFGNIIAFIIQSRLPTVPVRVPQELQTFMDNTS